MTVSYGFQRKARVSDCIVAVLIWQQKVFICLECIVANTLPSVLAPWASSTLLEKCFSASPPYSHFITMLSHFLMLFDFICVNLSSVVTLGFANLFLMARKFCSIKLFIVKEGFSSCNFCEQIFLSLTQTSPSC